MNHLDHLLTLVRSATLNPDSVQSLRDTANNIRNIETSDSAEKVIFDLVSSGLMTYSDTVEKRKG